jgi:hypothetical protein
MVAFLFILLMFARTFPTAARGCPAHRSASPPCKSSAQQLAPFCISYAPLGQLSALDSRRASCLPDNQALSSLHLSRAGGRHLRALSLFLLAVFLTGCWNEPEYTDQQRTCIAKQYPVYDTKILDQCVNVCKSCMGGNTVTCSTSCKLKGAS